MHFSSFEPLGHGVMERCYPDIFEHPPCSELLFSRFGPCDSAFYGKKWGCSSGRLRYHRKHSATGVFLHLSRDGGGISVGSLRGGHERVALDVVHV